MLGRPPPSQRQRHDEASLPVSKPVPRSNRMPRHGVTPHPRRRGSCLHSSSGQGGGSPCQSRGWQAAAAKPRSALPPLIVDGVEKMCYQLTEIHAITTAQLAECARWHRSDSTPSLVWAGTSWPKPNVTPSMIRLAPSPLLISHPRPRYGGSGSVMTPMLAANLARIARSPR
jgi:hypothetical protein